MWFWICSIFEWNTCLNVNFSFSLEIFFLTSDFPKAHYRLRTLHILTSAILHIKNGYTPVMIIQVITKDFVHATFMFDTQHVSHCDTEGSKKAHIQVSNVKICFINTLQTMQCINTIYLNTFEKQSVSESNALLSEFVVYHTSLLVLPRPGVIQP